MQPGAKVGGWRMPQRRFDWLTDLLVGAIGVTASVRIGAAVAAWRGGDRSALRPAPAPVGWAPAERAAAEGRRRWYGWLQHRIVLGRARRRHAPQPASCQRPAALSCRARRCPGLSGVMVDQGIVCRRHTRIAHSAAGGRQLMLVPRQMPALLVVVAWTRAFTSGGAPTGGHPLIHDTGSSRAARCRGGCTAFFKGIKISETKFVV
jgi:hypothetical protein